MGLALGDGSELDKEIENIFQKSEPKQKSLYTNHGTYISRSNILFFPGGKLVALASLALVGFVLVKYDFPSTNDISALEVDGLKDLVKTVAACEDKSTMKVYAEIKSEYNIYNLKKISKSTYREIKENLELRNCKPPVQEAFLLHDSTIE